MQPYDKAYELARSIRKSEEYKKLKAKREEVEKNQSYQEILDTYRTLQAELQDFYLRDETPSEELQERAQKISTTIQNTPVVAEYLQAEERFTILMQDLQRIVLEPMQEIMLNR